MNKLTSNIWLSSVVEKAQSWSWCCVFLPETLKVSGFSKEVLTSDGNSKLDAFMDQAPVFFKNEGSTTVVQISRNQCDFVLKRYNARGALHVVSRALRKTRARRCWQLSYEFAQAGLNVAAPSLMYEQRFGPLRLDAYFMCEKLEGEELLGLLPLMGPDEKQAVLAQMTLALKQMRTAKLSHGDMKATNILWHKGELYFIDLDGAVKNRFYFTWKRRHQKDLKRFMKNWQDHPELLALFQSL